MSHRVRALLSAVDGSRHPMEHTARWCHARLTIGVGGDRQNHWADHLNQLGNEGAHPEDYDEVTAVEAEALGGFVRHLIRHEYEMPAQLLRAQGLLKDDDPEDADV